MGRKKTAQGKPHCGATLGFYVANNRSNYNPSSAGKGFMDRRAQA